MYILKDGKPIFYTGKINGVGYTSEEERQTLLEEFAGEEIVEEDVIIDEDFKSRAQNLGELQLTYSKSEFNKYLTGEKSDINQLQNENMDLRTQISVLSDTLDFIIDNMEVE